MLVRGFKNKPDEERWLGLKMSTAEEKRRRGRYLNATFKIILRHTKIEYNTSSYLQDMKALMKGMPINYGKQCSNLYQDKFFSNRVINA